MLSFVENQPTCSCGCVNRLSKHVRQIQLCWYVVFTDTRVNITVVWEIFIVHGLHDFPDGPLYEHQKVVVWHAACLHGGKFQVVSGHGVSQVTDNIGGAAQTLLFCE